MFTSTDVIVALIVGVVFGLAAGVVLTGLLVVDPLLRERRVFRDRIVAEQLRTYAAGARLTAQQMLKDRQSDTFSRKVADLKAVK